MLAERKHRVTLMGQQMLQGAGGRMSETTPLIAEVWATLDRESAQLSSRQSRQRLNDRLHFTIPYSPTYMATKIIRFEGRLYLIASLSRNHTLQPTITIEASEKAS